MNLENEEFPFLRLVSFLQQQHDETVVDRKTAAAILAAITDRCTPGETFRSNLEIYVAASFFVRRAKIQSFKDAFASIKGFAVREILADLKARRLDVKNHKQSIHQTLQTIALNFPPHFK